MPIPIETLQNLAASLQTVISGNDSANPVQTINASITPSLAGMTATEFLPSPMNVNLKFLTKGVVTSDDDLVSPFDEATINGNTVDGLPIEGLLGSTDLVPGNIGQLAGTIDLPFPVTVPVGAEVTWEVRDENGTKNEGSDYLAPNGLNGFNASFIIPPVIVELTNDYIPTFKSYQIVANVTLKGGVGGNDFPKELVATVRVPSIAVPTVLTMFLHSNFSATGKFGGAALVVVPNNSPLRNLTQLRSVLNTLSSQIAPLTSFIQFATLLTGMTSLSNKIAVHLPRVAYRATDQIKNLNNIDLIKRKWYQNDIEAEDELSSLMFLGVAGKKAQFFNDRNFKTGQGQFDLTIGKTNDRPDNAQLFTFIETLHSSRPQSKPLGTEIEIIHSAKSFGDSLSSLRFAGNAIAGESAATVANGRLVSAID